MLKTILTLLVILSLVFLGITSCRSDSSLSPGEVDDSMLNTVVQVKGKITYGVENPMGVGGYYMKLSDRQGEVDVRIQPDLWDGYTANEKNQYEEGRTVTVKGLLVKAGLDLVIVHGKFAGSANTTISQEQ